MLEHDQLKDELVDPEDQQLIEEFESRIRKTDTDEERKYYAPKSTFEYEEEEEESENEQIRYQEKVNPHRENKESKKYSKAKDYNSYEESGSGKESDYEDVLNQTYLKAKKYKRKAKKLYSNLQRLKIHYEKAKQKIAELEFENHGINDKLLVFSNKVDKLQHAYDRL